jgi:hypothetical protein
VTCANAHPARNYADFGRDVKALAENLDILKLVVTQATLSLWSQGDFRTSVRWDSTSLLQIIGDYERTIRECRALVEGGKRYGIGTRPVRNIEWNVLVQPNVDRLQGRIKWHNERSYTFSSLLRCKFPIPSPMADILYG